MIRLNNKIDKYMKQRPTIRQLSLLIALHEHQNFSRAAAACFVTQSTMSAGLKELESILDVALVERTRRSVHFTPIGEKIVSQAIDMLRQSDAMIELCQSSAVDFSEPIKCGIIPTIAPYLLPEAMSILSKDIPQAQIYIREDQSSNIVAKLISGDLDMIILALPYPLKHLPYHIIGQEGFDVVVPADHAFASQRIIKSEQLRSEKTLMLEEGHCLRDHALSACKYIEPDKIQEFQGTSLQTLVQMVNNDLGITLVPHMAIAAGILNSTTAKHIPLDSQSVGREIALVWRENSPRRQEFMRLTPAFEKAMPKA